MKFLYKLFLIIFSYSIFISCQKQQSEIHSIGFYTTTITSVSCEKLKKTSHKKSKILSDEENAKLLTLFSQLKPIESDVNLDARLYGNVYDKSKEINFCMNIGIIEINGMKFYVSDDLKQYMLFLSKKIK